MPRKKSSSPKTRKFRATPVVGEHVDLDSIIKDIGTLFQNQRKLQLQNEQLLRERANIQNALNSFWEYVNAPKPEMKPIDEKLRQHDQKINELERGFGEQVEQNGFFQQALSNLNETVKPAKKTPSPLRRMLGNPLGGVQIKL